MKRFLVSGALVLGSLAVAFALAEGALRALGFSAPIWHRPDAQLGWTLRPNASGWFTQEGRALVAVNADGRRDPGYPLAKPAGTYRIAVLGDSYSEAMQVPREETYWALLPERLRACGFMGGRRVEVLNFGVSGYGTAQELLAFEARAAAYRPDLVLLQFTNGNDVRDNSIALDDNPTRPFFVAAPDGTFRLDTSFRSSDEFRRITSWAHEAYRELAASSRVLQLARAAKRVALFADAQADSGVEQGLEPMVLAPPKDERWEQAWRLTERLIGALHEKAMRAGARFVVFTVPYAIQVHPDREVRERLQAKLGVPDLFYPDRRLAALSRGGIEVLPLAPRLQPLAETHEVYFHGFGESGMGRGHWNAAGHRAAADLIAEYLCAS